MSQDDLFAYARHTDPATSHDAAKFDVTRLERIVHETVRRHPNGLTAEEVADITGIDLQSITPRFKPLEDRGFLRREHLGATESGTAIYKKRPGASGRGRIIWFAR
jgi:DNA-binding MarR family transcriptional regulator